MNQVIDFSTLQKGQPEVATPTEQEQFNSMVKDLQRQEANLIEPLVVLFDQILLAFCNSEELRKCDPNEVKMKTDAEGHLILIDDEPIPERDESGNCLPAGNARQQFTASVVSVLESMIDHQNTELDLRMPLMVLGRTMSRQLVRAFGPNREEHQSAVNKAFELTTKFIIDVLQNKANNDIPDICYYMLPASLLDYLSWNAKAGLAIQQMGMNPEDAAPLLGLKNAEAPTDAEPQSPAEVAEPIPESGEPSAPLDAN